MTALAQGKREQIGAIGAQDHTQMLLCLLSGSTKMEDKLAPAAKIINYKSEMLKSFITDSRILDSYMALLEPFGKPAGRITNMIDGIPMQDFLDILDAFNIVFLTEIDIAKQVYETGGDSMFREYIEVVSYPHSDSLRLDSLLSECAIATVDSEAGDSNGNNNSNNEGGADKEVKFHA